MCRRVPYAGTRRADEGGVNHTVAATSEGSIAPAASRKGNG